MSSLMQFDVLLVFRHIIKDKMTRIIFIVFLLRNLNEIYAGMIAKLRRPKGQGEQSPILIEIGQTKETHAFPFFMVILVLKRICSRGRTYVRRATSATTWRPLLPR